MQSVALRKDGKMKADDVCSIVIGILDAYMEGVEWDGVGHDASMVEQGMDSMTFIQVVVDIEARFDIEIPDEYLLAEKMGTIGRIVDVVCGLLDGSK